MNKEKFRKGDLIWQKTRGYGIVLEVGSLPGAQGVADYAVVRYADNKTRKVKYFRHSIGWDKTEIRARTKEYISG